MHQQIRNKWIHFTHSDIFRFCIMVSKWDYAVWCTVLSDCAFCYSATLYCRMVHCSIRLCRAVCEGRLTNVLAAAGREEPALQLQLTPVLLRQHHHQDGEAWQLQRWISWPLGPIQRITIIQFHIVSIIWPLLYLISNDNTIFIRSLNM